MKKILLSILFLLPLFSVGQNTWMRKLSYNIQLQGYLDILTGVSQIEPDGNGAVYLIGFTSADHSNSLMKLSADSGKVIWTAAGGYNGMMVTQWLSRCKVTSDLGVVICRNHMDEQSGITTSHIEKYSASGVFEWSHIFLGLNYYDKTAWDVYERSNGNYRVLVDDTMYTLDHFGNPIDSTGSISGIRFEEMPNGDLLLQKPGNSLQRVDSLGNIIWTSNCDGAFGYDSMNVFISHSNTFIKKVNAVSGIQIWDRDYGFTHLSELRGMNTGGFMASAGSKPVGPYGYGAVIMPGILFCTDSLGDTLWTRTYSLPQFGLSTFNVLPNGSICTGGCYMSGYTIYGNYAKDFSAFCCMMNTDGSFPLAQTNYISPGDANADHNLNFVDDALEMMVALGNTGPFRDTAFYGNDPILNQYYYCEWNSLSIDWPTSSSTGVNHKYSDYDGNGIIDTSDILLNTFCEKDSVALEYRLANSSQFQNVEDFCLIPLNDTLQFYDTAYFYMVLGNNFNPVDSIYGFAFSFYGSINYVNFTDSIFPWNSDLGTIGNNLYSCYDYLSMIPQTSQYRSHILMCRMNGQNAVGVNDTLGLIRFIGNFYSSPFTPVITDFKAILADGTEIPVNVCVGSMIVDTSILFMNEHLKEKVKVYPNPADKEIKIKNEKLIIEKELNVDIFNLLGEKVKSIPTFIPGESISVADLPDGFYTGQLMIDNGVKNFSFVVKH